MRHVFGTTAVPASSVIDVPAFMGHQSITTTMRYVRPPHTVLSNLNDHLGGATLGSDLAGQIRDHSEGSPLGDLMVGIAREIEADRQTLAELMEQLGRSTNAVKQVIAWVAETASRAKFAGTTSGEPDFGLFMALETLTSASRASCHCGGH